MDTPTIKTGYYGASLIEAYENCMADAPAYDVGVKTYKIISARLLMMGVKVEFTDIPCEFWEFECVLIY